jgi:hypothetical protein
MLTPLSAIAGFCAGKGTRAKASYIESVIKTARQHAPNT